MSTNFFLLLLSYINIAKCAGEMGAGPLNFIFHNFYNCAKKPTPMNLTITSRWLNHSYQVVDGHLFTPVEIGDNMLAKVSAEILIHDKWVHLADLSELFCRGMRNYLGPIRGEILGAVGLPGDTCPIPQGSYHARNVHLDFKKSRIPALPYGTFNMTAALYQKSTKILNLCLSIELENKPS